MWQGKVCALSDRCLTVVLHVPCVYLCRRLWMNKQDRAFTGWLNHLLMPYTPEYLRAASEGDTSAALSDLRLAARVQGAMVACYRCEQRCWLVWWAPADRLTWKQRSFYVASSAFVLTGMQCRYKSAGSCTV